VGVVYVTEAAYSPRAQGSISGVLVVSSLIISGVLVVSSLLISGVLVVSSLLIILVFCAVLFCFVFHAVSYDHHCLCIWIVRSYMSVLDCPFLIVRS